MIAVGTAISRFTYRHQRHEMVWVSTPPSNSPTEAPPAAIALKIPNALGRSGDPWKVTVSSPSAEGASSAPKAPCSARAATSIPNDCARPPIAEATAKPVSPPMKRPLAAEEIAELAAQQQQAAEGEGVGGDDPLPAVGREVQRALRRGQRDVHDRRVEHDHQLRDPEQGQHGPSVGVRYGGGA